MEKHRGDKHHGSLDTLRGRFPFLMLILQVGTHADSLVAEAAVKGITGFDPELAWEAVSKNAFVPPFEDTTVV